MENKIAPALDIIISAGTNKNSMTQLGWDAFEFCMRVHEF